MLAEYFKQYMEIAGKSESSVSHYLSGIRTINTILKNKNFRIQNIYDVKSKEDLDDIFGFLLSDDDFVNLDKTGHSMYSVAFKHFYNFACNNYLFFSKNINKMDIAVPMATKMPHTSTAWKRNQILIVQSIEGANYLCEHDNKHHTFISESTGKQYMEGHHLIPMMYQSKFNTSIDVYANIVCLCPVCHRMMHFGTSKEKTYVAEQLYDERQNRLINSGIDLSKKDFLDLVI